jgi:hypothetical protein
MWFTNVDSDDDNNSTEPTSSYKDPLGSGRMVTSKYSDSERVRLGSALPDFYGGISNSLSYRNFDLNFYFYYSLGSQVYNYDYAINMHDGTSLGYNLSTDALNAWTPNNKFTDVPKYVANNQSNSSQLSSRYLEDASYLRLKNVSLSYNIPSNIAKKMRMKTMRVYVTGENLWTLTNYKGFDPEVGINGVTSSSIPGVKVISFGLKMDL